MTMKDADRKFISEMTESQAKTYLYSAVTAMKKVADNVPDIEKKNADSYNSAGHMKCVNYLNGFLNVWRRGNGS